MCESSTSDEMTSFEVLHTQNGTAESFDSSEFSFLPEHPPSHANQVINSQANSSVNMTNIQSAFVSATPDLSIEEAEKRLVDLLEDNETLKLTLQTNSKKLQEQMEALSVVLYGITSSTSKQEADLQEAKEKIFFLEKENAELHGKVESNAKALSDNECCIKCNALQTITSSLQKEKDLLQKDKSELLKELKQEKDFHKQLEQNILGISTYLHHLQFNSKLLEAEKKELTALNNALQLKLSSLGTGCETITQTDEETGYEIVQQKDSKDEEVIKDYLLQLREAQDKIEEMSELLKLQNKEIESLKNVSIEQQKLIDTYEHQQKEQEESAKAKFEVTQNEWNLASAVAEKYRERCEISQQERDECQAKLEQTQSSSGNIIRQLQEEVKNLQDRLKVEQVNSQEDRSRLSEARKQFEKLQCDYDRVTKLFEIQSKDQKEKDQQLDTVREVEAKKNLEQIDKLTAQLLDTEQKLEEREEKVQELTSELDKTKKDSEVIPILKAQVNVYKTDLNNAVLARDSAHETVEKLTRELKNLQSAASCPHCEASSDAEVKAEERESFKGAEASLLSGKLRKHRILRKDKAYSKSGNKWSEPRLSLESQVYFCPICNFCFKDIQALENHVNTCLDKSNEN